MSNHKMITRSKDKQGNNSYDNHDLMMIGMIDDWI